MKYALVNQSQADSNAFPVIAEACLAFLRQFCVDQGLDPSTRDVIVVSDASGVPAGYVKALVKDTLPEAPGALAYHDRDDYGNPIVYAGFSAIPNGELFCGPNGDGSSLVGELQHEIAEAEADPWANSYVDIDVTDPQGSGKVYHVAAFEMCDMVQENADTIIVDGTKCDRINYGLPRWFDPTAPKGTKVDRLGMLPGPGTVAAGGYVIVREAFTQDEQVFARNIVLEHRVKMAAWRAAKKKHSRSRTSRRLSQVIKLGAAA